MNQEKRWQVFGPAKKLGMYFDYEKLRKYLDQEKVSIQHYHHHNHHQHHHHQHHHHDGRIKKGGSPS